MRGFGQKFENKKVIKKGSNISNAKIKNQALILHSQGKIKEAEKYYKYCIDNKINSFIFLKKYS